MFPNGNLSNEVPKKLLDFQEFLVRKIRQDRINGVKLFQELKDRGYSGSYNTLNRFLNTLNRYTNRANHRFETDPGEQAQVDWGHFGKVEVEGIDYKLYCFVYMLSYSRMMYAEFTTKMDLQTFEQCHVNAFEAVGRSKNIVYDNLKTVVLRRENIGSPHPHIVYNPAFLDFSQYYGFQIIACPPYWPKSKGKVEAGVKYIRNNFMNTLTVGKKGDSIVELNNKLSKWLHELANSRVHRTTNEIPYERWLKERKSLNFIEDFPLYSFSTFVSRNTTLDGLVQYKSNFYSVPLKYSRRKVQVKEIKKNGLAYVEVYCGDQIIANHLMGTERGKWIEDKSHRPTAERKLTKFQLIKQVQSVQITNNSLDYYDRLIP